MKPYEGYLIDLDGTMYRGRESIDGAKQFIENLNRSKIPYLFVTNNSSLTPEAATAHLRSFGIETTKEHILTSALAMAHYVSTHLEVKTAFIIGEEGLIKALTDIGIEHTEVAADLVVMGIDRQLTYEKLRHAAINLQNGAQFLATNPDIKIPTETGFVPGNGAFTSLVAQVANQEPTYIGKPHRLMIDIAIEKIGVARHKVIMVGDNYETDIMAGIQAGVDTLHVQTGVTSKEALASYAIQPTFSVETLAEWKIEVPLSRK